MSRQARQFLSDWMSKGCKYGNLTGWLRHFITIIFSKLNFTQSNRPSRCR